MPITPRSRLRFSVPLAAACAILLSVSAFSQSVDTTDGHRPLRSNPIAAEAAPDPVPLSGFTGYPAAPPYEVLPRTQALRFFPCAACHDHIPPNPERRALASPHPAALDHGDGRIWCLDCHAADSRNHLATLAGEQLSFDQSDRVCAQCHYGPHRDWAFGAHGKRQANWQGERRLYSCAHCHDPHSPAIRPRAPEPPPRVRAGLEPMSGSPDGEKHVDGEVDHDRP